METIDSLISARWMVPVIPSGKWYDHYSIAINEGKILELLPTAEARKKYQSNNTPTLDQHVLLPGLINCHTHASMSLFRGMADDLALMDWLENHIWPAEAQWVTPEFVESGTRLALAEMLKGGTTCCNEMYFFPDVAASVAAVTGIRITVGLIILGFPTAWAKSSDDYFHKGLEVHDIYRSSTLIQTVFAPHAPYTVSDPDLRKISTLAEELDISIHMHLHETANEVSDSKKMNGKSPIQRLHELGVLSPRLISVHMTSLDQDELDLVKESGTHIVHCPESNMKLSSGMCPVQTLTQQGINVALGTDGAASNNDLDMFGEMRTAAMLAKIVSENATAMPAANILQMATLNGARALGLEDSIGSLCVGKAADLIAVDLSSLATQPVYNPISQLVYAACRDQVTDVWVAGKKLLSDRKLTTMNEQSVINEAQVWCNKIKAGQAS